MQPHQCPIKSRVPVCCGFGSENLRARTCTLARSLGRSRAFYYTTRRKNGGRDGCCPRSLLLDRQANMLLLLASETGGPPAHGNARGRLPEAARQGATRWSESVNLEGAVDGASAPPCGLCCAQSVSRRSLVRFIFQNWLPQMDSHHHRRIQGPLSYCWATGQDKVVNPEVVATSPMSD